MYHRYDYKLQVVFKIRITVSEWTRLKPILCTCMELQKTQRKLSLLSTKILLILSRQPKSWKAHKETKTTPQDCPWDISKFVETSFLLQKKEAVHVADTAIRFSAKTVFDSYCISCETSVEDIRPLFVKSWNLAYRWHLNNFQENKENAFASYWWESLPGQ